jgi:hypothetical protein
VKGAARTSERTSLKEGLSFCRGEMKGEKEKKE